eukprot:1147211-Pelagomonas_calceolata.AAC.8
MQAVVPNSQSRPCNPCNTPLPPASQSKFVRLFALDVGGQQGHDQYVYLVPNGLAIVGLAPSHILLHNSTHTSAATEHQQQQIQGGIAPREGGQHVAATEVDVQREQEKQAGQGVGTVAQGEGQTSTADGDGAHLQGQNTNPGQSSQQSHQQDGGSCPNGQQQPIQHQSLSSNSPQEQQLQQQHGNDRSISQQQQEQQRQQQQQQHECQAEDQQQNKRFKHAPAPKPRNPLPFTAEQLVGFLDPLKSLILWM